MDCLGDLGTSRVENTQVLRSTREHAVAGGGYGGKGGGCVEVGNRQVPGMVQYGGCRECGSMWHRQEECQQAQDRAVEQWVVRQVQELGAAKAMVRMRVFVDQAVGEIEDAKVREEQKKQLEWRQTQQERAKAQYAEQRRI